MPDMCKLLDEVEKKLYRIAVANKPVGDFERETDLKTSFEPD